jgi:ATP-dependent Lhr-like helicase
MEERRPVREPLDVLAQHVVTVGVGPGFTAREMLATVRRTWSYQELSKEEFERVLSMVREGGGTLKAYPEYHKVEADGEGVYRVTTPRLAHLHRLNIGTITGDGTLEIRLQSGKRLGNIEESFISRLGAGDAFFFAGRMVEFVALRELTAIVRMSKKRSALTPIWGGTRLPISESLGAAVRESLEKLGGFGSDESGLGVDELGEELRCAAPLGRAQRGMSAVPRRDQTLVEMLRTREGEHLFVYPFAGRLVHAGLGALLALRMGRNVRTTFAIAQNDYGFEVLAEEGYPFAEMMTKEIFSTRDLAADVAASVELSALAKLQFREIARISGLVFQQHPGARKSSRQLQASSGLIFDVFSEFDPENILLMQARKEVLERQFEESRLARTMQRIGEGELLVRTPRSPTPLGLPLVVERLGARLSTETVLDRVRKMKDEWERAAKEFARGGKGK